MYDIFFNLHLKAKSTLYKFFYFLSSKFKVTALSSGVFELNTNLTHFPDFYLQTACRDFIC